MIKLENVNKYFFKGRPNEIHVINDISLELPSKGLVGLFGKSGCGKTTLLNTIGGLDDFKSGLIQVEGEDIKKNTDMIRNKYMGYIFQNYNLNLLVSNYENVAESLRLCGMTDEEEIGRRVLSALKCVGLEKYAKRMPDTLSGGQKQRIAIARAIVKNPAIILADEPTGNLDEKNTIMIMNLLKNISRDHLVLLVTHESNLVDYYCDTVIELSDGQIMKVRENSDANGYVAREKNVVYLGELEKKELSSGKVAFEYFGDEAPEELKIQLVNQNGVLMLKVNSPKVKLLDENSEVIFKEGVFEETVQKKEQENRIDMSELTSFEGKKYGRLFTFKNSARESVNDLLRKQKGVNKGLRKVMMFFAMLITLLIAVQAKNLKAYFNADEAYNHNEFYIYAPKNEIIANIYDAFDEGRYGIDDINYDLIGKAADEMYEIDTEIFETYQYYGGYYDAQSAPLKGHGVTLSQQLAEKYDLLYGKNTNLSKSEIVITKRIAEIIVENSKFEYIDDISDLLGYSVMQYNGRIAGIVDNDEPAIYINEAALVRYTADIMVDGKKLSVNYDVNEGEIEIDMPAAKRNDSLKEGDTFSIAGLELKISKINYHEELSFEKYLQDNYGIVGTITSESAFGDSYEIEIVDSDGNYQYISIGNEEYFKLKNGKDDTTDYYINENDFIRLHKISNKSLDTGFFKIHTTEPKATEDFLREIYSGIDKPNGIPYLIKTPNDIRASEMKNVESAMEGSLVVTCVVAALLCLCMYMIMRSNIMARVREVGVYRCIGVTKKNMTFKFVVESFILTSLSVLPGFLIIVLFIFYVNNFTALALNIFMPLWLSLPLIGLLYIACVFCGTLPTVVLLGKTPSQIMAKYDV